MRKNSLHLNNVFHAFGAHTVLNGVSIFVAPGETACLLGPSGCGKTTLLRVAAGLETLQSGQVAIGDRLVAQGRGGAQLPPEARGIGFVFQDYALFPHLTIRDNISFGLRNGKAARGVWVENALARFGLAGHADKYPHALSGGQQQRVSLLRALAPEPGVMLLDEPFS
ncbi:MAG: ATP-binding cassette domain-containing protein, partial [Rhodospirillales bacterium]|nr:ATP-binding cassette domain-containing protein [Rhodospirillales bacterium]